MEEHAPETYLIVWQTCFYNFMAGTRLKMIRGSEIRVQYTFFFLVKSLANWNCFVENELLCKKEVYVKLIK